MPRWLSRWLSKPVKVSDAARALATLRHNRERNRVIDRANEMRAAMGMDLIPRREV